MAVVGDYNRHDGRTSLHRQMKSALFERQKHGLLCVASRSLGEHENALALRLNSLGGTAHRRPSILAIGAVNEDGAAETHEPAEKGVAAQLTLGGHAAVLREHTAQHQHIELCLVVGNKDSRTRRAQDILGIINLKREARQQRHSVLEGASCGPLRYLPAVTAREAQDDGSGDTEKRAADECHNRRQHARNKASQGADVGQEVKHSRDNKVADKEPGDGRADGGHDGEHGGQ